MLLLQREANTEMHGILALLTFAPMGVIKRDVGAIARRLIADSSDDIFPNNEELLS